VTKNIKAWLHRGGLENLLKKDGRDKGRGVRATRKRMSLLSISSEEIFLPGTDCDPDLYLSLISEKLNRSGLIQAKPYGVRVISRIYD